MENRNNFIRWTGGLVTSPFENIAPGVNTVMATNSQYVDVPLLGSVTSTFGADPNSVSASSFFPNNMRPPTWNPTTQTMRIFRPSVMPFGLAAQVSYFFRDWQGNPSNYANINVDLTLVNLAWRAVPSSSFCLTNPYGIRTGEQGWTTLELYYPLTSVAYAPYTTKANSSLDPDYIAPITNTTACPLPSTASLLISNETVPGPNSVTIQSVVWKRAPFPNVVQTVNLAPGAQVSLLLPTGIYDEVDFNHTHTGSITGLFTWRFYPGNTNLQSGALNNTNSPIVILNPTHAQPGSTIKFL